MSPTVFRYKRYRFFFFSREEKRVHVHVHCSDGEAKFWLEPDVELANNYGLSNKILLELKNIIIKKKDEIKNDWNRHFRNRNN